MDWLLTDENITTSAVLIGTGLFALAFLFSCPLIKPSTGGQPPMPSALAMAAAPPGAGPSRRSCLTESLFFRRKLGQQMRRVASNNAAYFIINGSYDLEAFLDLPADQLKFLRA